MTAAATAATAAFKFVLVSKDNMEIWWPGFVFEDFENFDETAGHVFAEITAKQHWYNFLDAVKDIGGKVQECYSSQVAFLITDKDDAPLIPSMVVVPVTLTEDEFYSDRVKRLTHARSYPGWLAACARAHDLADTVQEAQSRDFRLVSRVVSLDDVDDDHDHGDKKHTKPNEDSKLPPNKLRGDQIITIEDDDDDENDRNELVCAVEAFEAENLTLQGPYTLAQFETLWKQVEMNFGGTTEEIENGRLIRGANSKMPSKGSRVQSRAQYGRLLHSATHKLLTEIFCLKETDVFLDVGHGIGNTCLQASYTIGCESRGIEVVPDRDLVAQQFRSDLDFLNQIHLKKDNVLHKIGKVDLRLGSLEDSCFRTFLTQGVTATFVNNFDGVFKERSSENTHLPFLDDYIVGLFGMMAPGATLISLHPLPLCLSKSSANEQRRRFQWAPSENASFFDYEELVLGEARYCVSWSQFGGNSKMIRLFKYTRVGQSVFLCCNHNCQKARNAVPIEAIVENSQGRMVLNKCECGFEGCKLRR